jgi:hypothetical protein
MLHVFVMALKCFASVSDICFKCFNYFKRMLQVFYLDVAKSRSGVTHVTMGPHAAVACCSCWGVRKHTRHERSLSTSAWKAYKARVSSGLYSKWYVRSGWCRPPCGCTGCRRGKRGTGTGASVEQSLRVFDQASGVCGPGGAGPRVGALGVDVGNEVLVAASERAVQTSWC